MKVLRQFENKKATNRPTSKCESMNEFKKKNKTRGRLRLRLCWLIKNFIPMEHEKWFE
jgi:hypothetical protein